MEKQTIEYFDYKTHTQKSMEVPICTKYEYLKERNKKYMDYTALSFENRKITYEELHTRINEYARALAKKGIRKGDMIAVCAANTPESIYLMYALDKLGAITVGLSPLNNEYQMKRDIEMIRPKMVIVVDMLYGKVKNAVEALNISPILFSPLESVNNPFMKAVYNGKQLLAGNKLFGREFNLSKVVQDGKKFNYIPETIEDDYVSDIMFTGGSTGVHKGVELQGNGFNCLARALDEVFFLEPGQIHLGNVPINHMVFGKALTHYVLCSNLEYALTLKMTPQYFTDEVIRTKANGIMGGPIHFENFIGNSKITPGCFSSVEQAVSGGEHFKAKKKMAAEAELRKGGSKAIIGNAIGSTETESVTHISIIDTRNYTDMNAYPFNVDYEKNPVTCGYPIPGINYKIVDPETRVEVEKGKPGLFLVSGPTIMKGYYNNPEENAKVFSYDENGVKWLNQGDIMCNTGENLEEVMFSGRKKRNFVCNVTNIYPEEIESMLLRFDEIREVIVTPVPDAKYQFLPSYHISLNSPDCDTEKLRNKIELFIKQTLGDDALPGYISFTIEPLPRTDNGKLNAPLLEKEDLEQLKQENRLTLVRKKY